MYKVLAIVLLLFANITEVTMASKNSATPAKKQDVPVWLQGAYSQPQQQPKAVSNPEPPRGTYRTSNPGNSDMTDVVPAWAKDKNKDIPWWKQDVSITHPVGTGSFLSNNGQTAYGNNQTNLYQGESVPSWMLNKGINRPNINTNYYTNTIPTGSFLSNNGQTAYGNNQTNRPSQSSPFSVRSNPNVPTVPTGSFLAGNGQVFRSIQGALSNNIPNWMYINPNLQVGWVAGAGNINPNYPTVPTGSFLANNGQSAGTGSGQTQSSYTPPAPNIGNRQEDYRYNGQGPQVADGNIYNNNAPGTTQFGTPNMGVNTFIGGGGEAVRSPQARGRTMFGAGVGPGTLDPSLWNLSAQGNGGGGSGGFGSRYGGNWGGGGGGGGWDYGGGGSNDYPAWVKTLMGLNSWNIK